MQPEVLICLWMIWSSAVSIAPKKGSSTSPTLSLGDKIFRKQEECEEIISQSINEILNNEESNLHDFPIPDEDYYSCKEALDKMKRDYMNENHIDKSTYPELFPIKLTEGSLVIPVPDEEGAERDDLEFDLNEELCVTSRTCRRLLDLLDKEKGKDKRSTEKFAHCSILLDDVKLKYIKENELDIKTIKDEGGLSVVCSGKKVSMPLPYMINNLDYHETAHELFNDTPMGDSPQPTAAEALPAAEATPAVEGPSGHVEEAHIHTAEQEKPGEQVQPAEESPKPTEGSKSNAFVEKANLFYVTIIFVVLFAIM